MPEKITASGWYVSIRCWVVAAALTSPMPPTVATAVTVPPSLVPSVPRVTSRPAWRSWVTSFSDAAMSATSSSNAPMMAMVVMGILPCGCS